MLDENQILKEDKSQEELGMGLQVLSFCIPLAGAIIYVSYMSNSPRKAKSACYAALWGLGIGVIINILVTLAG
ncbi:MAG: hypothetical protein WAT43_07815 [Chitinophagales bacterium]